MTLSYHEEEEASYPLFQLVGTEVVYCMVSHIATYSKHTGVIGTFLLSHSVADRRDYPLDQQHSFQTAEEGGYCMSYMCLPHTLPLGVRFHNQANQYLERYTTLNSFMLFAVCRAVVTYRAACYKKKETKEYSGDYNDSYGGIITSCKYGMHKYSNLTQ